MTCGVRKVCNCQDKSYISQNLSSKPQYSSLGPEYAVAEKVPYQEI